MTTVTAPACSASDPMIRVADMPDFQRFVLRGVTWEQYRAFSETLSDRHLRLTYDRGTLELMTISSEHSFLCRLFHDMVKILAKASGLRCRSCGDMTCDRQDLDRGFSPDECYYLTNELAVRGKMKLDFSVDPPPDLGIEVDITSDARTRLPLYAAFGVGEVWRYKDERVTFLCLQADETYVVVDNSRIFRCLTPGAIEEILRQRTETDEDTLLEEFAAWVRRAMLTPRKRRDSNNP